MLVTWHTHRRMRLYRCRLDMRACHPADNLDRVLTRGFHAPLPGFHGKHRYIASLEEWFKWKWVGAGWARRYCPISSEGNLSAISPNNSRRIFCDLSDIASAAFERHHTNWKHKSASALRIHARLSNDLFCTVRDGNRVDLHSTLSAIRAFLLA